MSKKLTRKQSSEGLDQDGTDWDRLDAMKDKDIDTSDILELDVDFFKQAKVIMPPKKSM
jgi:hypothetical protein